MWNEFLPISIPIAAGETSRFCDMAWSLSSVPPCQHPLLVGREHGRTIPLADVPGGVSAISAAAPHCILGLDSRFRWARQRLASQRTSRRLVTLQNRIQVETHEVVD